MEMLLYAAAGLLAIAAATIFCVLCQRKRLRQTHWLVLTVRDAESAEQRLREFALRAGAGARLAVRCTVRGEAAEICRRFCRDRGLFYLPEKMYNTDITRREKAIGDGM